MPTRLDELAELLLTVLARVEAEDAAKAAKEKAAKKRATAKGTKKKASRQRSS